ncbi:MAG: murein L,D-transpeptidase [Actinobacteria bacterium]|nr:murein L,D-transpeptidase [Actinomycetota bacterium]
MTVVPPTTPPSTPVAPPAAVTEPEVRSTLRPGAKGPEVLALQQRLRSLGYWLGEPDGTYGDLTIQAVTAFQKVRDMPRDGIAGQQVARAVEAAGRQENTGGDENLIEIDKERQVMYIVRGGNVAWILNVSTGTDKLYRVNGRTERADTPSGRWRVTSAHDGVKIGELGAIYRPRFFHRDGIAVHGYRDVPNYPASHGCVRVSNAAMDWIWSADVMALGTRVWVY